MQFDCHNGTNQRFTIEQVTFGGKRIIRTNLNLNMCVGINTNSYANPGELLRLIPCRVNGDIRLRKSL